MYFFNFLYQIFASVYIYRQIKMGSCDWDCPLLRGSVADVCSINTFSVCCCSSLSSWLWLRLQLQPGFLPFIFSSPPASRIFVPTSAQSTRQTRPTEERDAYFFNRRPVTDFVPGIHSFPFRPPAVGTRFPHGKLNRFSGEYEGNNGGAVRRRFRPGQLPFGLALALSRVSGLPAVYHNTSLGLCDSNGIWEGRGTPFLEMPLMMLLLVVFCLGPVYWFQRRFNSWSCSPQSEVLSQIAPISGQI